MVLTRKTIIKLLEDEIKMLKIHQTKKKFAYYLHMLPKRQTNYLLIAVIHPWALILALTVIYLMICMVYNDSFHRQSSTSS